MNQSASTWFLVAMAVALAAVFISVFAKKSRVVRSPSTPGGPVPVHAPRYKQAVMQGDGSVVGEDEDEATTYLSDLTPNQPYSVGGDSPAALRAGNGPLVDDDCSLPPAAFDRGTMVQEQGHEQSHGPEDGGVAPFSGEEYNTW